jgi:hypothetical protein
MLLVESLNNTQAAGSAIIDAQGGVWTLAMSTTHGMVVVHNGVADFSVSNVWYLFYESHTVHLRTHAKSYAWNGTAWTSGLTWAAAATIRGKGQPRVVAGVPPPAVATESIQGTTIPPAVQIIDATGDVWTRASQGVACNGLTDLTTSKEDLLLYWNHQVYRHDTTGLWYAWLDAATPPPAH